MGLLIAKLYSLYETFGGSGQPSRILMLGLDAAGKLFLYSQFGIHYIHYPNSLYSVGLLNN